MDPGGAIPWRYKRHTDETIRAALAECVGGVKLMAVAAKYGVPESTLKRWYYRSGLPPLRKGPRPRPGTPTRG